MTEAARPGSRALWGASLLAIVPALLLFPVWNRVFAGHVGPAVLAAVIGWLWIAAIGTSGVLLWQGKERRPFGRTSYILSLATALSGFWLLVFYPAVMSWDALSQWQHAVAGRYTNWVPPLLPMVMHFTRWFVKGPGLLSFLQGSLFWGALFFLILQVAGSRRAFLAHSVLVALLPPLWLYSNAATSVTWGAIFLMLSMGLLIRSVKDGKEGLLFLSVLSLAVAVMFRREAILCVLVPVAAYLLYFPRKRGFAKTALAVAIMGVLSVAPARLIELAPSVSHVQRAQLHGVFTQYVGTMVHSMGRMSPSEIERERQSIDGAFGKGVFLKLIQRYDCSSGDYIIYKRDFPPVLGRIPKDKSFFVLKKVVRTALRHPWAYLEHQLCYLGHLTQFTSLGYQTWGALNDDPVHDAARARLGIPYRSQLPSVKAGYIRLLKSLLGHPVLSLIFRHYIFLLLSAVFLGLGLFRRKIEWIVPSVVSLLNVLAYLMGGPASLWRYLLPSYLGAWVCLPAVVASILRPAGKRSGTIEAESGQQPDSP
jgi:hypothetical protein